jgi:Putative prokaryotic signal transducing protein
MSDNDGELEIVATATDEMQEPLIVGRLSEAGIRCMRSGGGIKRSIAGPRSVYVEAADLERARAVLKEDEGGFDEDELARLSEEAGKEHPAEP